MNRAPQRSFLLVTSGATALLTKSILFPTHVTGSFTEEEFWGLLALPPCGIISVLGLILGIADLVKFREGRWNPALLVAFSSAMPLAFLARAIMYWKI